MKSTTLMELSMEGQRLDKFLLEAKVGEPISYAKLSEVCLRNVQEDGRGILNSSRLRLQRDYNIVFDVIRGEGIVRLSDKQIANLGPKHTGGIRRAARRGVKQLVCVQDFDKLDQVDKISHMTAMSQLGMIHLASKVSSAKKIEGVVASKDTALEIGDTLALFGVASQSRQPHEGPQPD